MKIGMHPMRVTPRLFLDWGITFGKPYEVPEQIQRPVAYASRKELEKAIYQCTHPKPEEELASPIEVETKSQADSGKWARSKDKQMLVVEEG